MALVRAVLAMMTVDPVGGPNCCPPNCAARASAPSWRARANVFPHVGCVGLKLVRCVHARGRAWRDEESLERAIHIGAPDSAAQPTADNGDGSRGVSQARSKAGDVDALRQSASGGSEATSGLASGRMRRRLGLGKCAGERFNTSLSRPARCRREKITVCRPRSTRPTRAHGVGTRAH